jgi:ferrochelatase
VSKITDAVFFISFGGPEKSEDIRPFLEIVTHGRRIPPERIDDVAHHYEVIGGASPINVITNRQAEGLHKQLGDVPVYVGNRNWHPFIEDTLRKMAADGIRRAIGFPTAAHRTEASWERYVNAVETARQKIGPSAPVITYVGPWFDHPLFIEAIAARIHDVKAPGSATWIFTAHSIPVPMAKASRYVQELEATATLICIRFGVKNWRLAYTSRSGAPTDPWLEPDVCDHIRELAQEGVRDVLAIPIGFVADHVEVLFDLDVEAKEAAQKVGVTLHRAQTVGDHPLFIQMIADVIKKAAVPPQIPSPLGRRQG